MNNNLLFDFTVDKVNNTINIKREFAANLELVWDAWTIPEILDQWWAPKPYQNETISMNFTEGGMWHYAMISPEGQRHYCKAYYKNIDAQKMYSYKDAFCNDKGEDLTEMPSMNWNNSFVINGNNTTVNIVINFETITALENIIQMGFKEGFTMAIGNLDQYLESRFKLMAENKTSNKARVCTYLNFDGKTEEAFTFYKSVFKTQFVGKGLQRFADIPASTEHPPIADAIKNMILHVELPITGNHILMATDAPKEMGFNLAKGNNMHICIEPETRQEADRLFNELSVDGNITMPMADMFFGAYFGEFTDRFGINWMINFKNN